MSTSDPMIGRDLILAGSAGTVISGGIESMSALCIGGEEATAIVLERPH